MLRIEVNKGLFNQVMKDYDKIFDKKIASIDKAFDENMKIMVADAQFAAPVGRSGRLKASINYLKKAKLLYELRADVGYAAYVEFGTGPNFRNYPGKEQVWQSKAREFYRNGKGKTFGRPFFYFTVTKNFPKLRDAIKKILSTNA